jgi:hypothetical protein
MVRSILSGVVLAICVLTAPVSAGVIDASGNMTAVADGAKWDYTITLTNTSGAGNDSIETFWYAWVPGHDFLPGLAPTNIIAPSGWTDIVTGSGSASDGFAIQFKTSTAALAPGSSLTFGFTSAESPTVLAGNSPFSDNPPIGTSFVYSGQPFAGDHAQFVVSSVPEPSSLLLGLFGAASTFGYLKLKNRKGIA